MNSEHEVKVTWREPRAVLKLVGILLVAAIIIIAMLRDRLVSNQQWTVNVVGRGTVEYEPDIATVNMGVQIEKVWGADVALTQLNKKVEQAIAAIKKLKVPDDAIRTHSYSLYPQYNIVENNSVLAGYGASQQIDVTIKDLKKNSELLRNVIAEATKAGVNQINGISFDVSNSDELKQQARIKALEAAQKNAATTASTAGVKLKKVVGWWENFVQGPEAFGYAFDGKGGEGGGGGVSPVIPTGVQKIVVEMNVTYLIK